MLMAASHSSQLREEYSYCSVQVLGKRVSCSKIYNWELCTSSGGYHLILPCSPSLTWRDVQYLIAYTANPHLTSGPLTRNGAGLAVSRQYGFGVMDAEAMVARARHWINVPSRVEDHVTPAPTSG